MKIDNQITGPVNPYVSNLTRSSFIQAEPSIKNAHSATHLRILSNRLVLLGVEESLHVYSLAKIAEGMAPLINVIGLRQVFQEYNKEHYEDMITSVFRKAEKEDFSSQIFNEEQDPKSNILLNISYLKDRINFFNNTKVRIKIIDIDPSGILVIILHDGRAAILTHPTGHWNNSSFQTLNLNQLTKEGIRNGCFVESDKGLVCLLLQNKIVCVDLADRNKFHSHKFNCHNVNQVYAKGIEKDRITVYIAGDQQLQVVQLGKKKIFSTKTVQLPQFINKCYFFKEFCFVSVQTCIVKVHLDSLTQDKTIEFGEPRQLTHIDEYGNYGKKSLKNNKESLWLVDSTDNGIFVGLTIRKQGNYKEGRLLVFQCPLSYYIQRLIGNVKTKRLIDTSDSIFIDSKSRQNKQAIHEFNDLSKLSTLSYKNIPLSQEEYYVVWINLGHAFEGKQIAKQKVIEKVLYSRFERLVPLKKKLDYNQLIERCCFTGTPLFDEDVVHCQKCHIFGIEGKGDQCVVCMRKMDIYE